MKRKKAFTLFLFLLFVIIVIFLSCDNKDNNNDNTGNIIDDEQFLISTGGPYRGGIISIEGNPEKAKEGTQINVIASPDEFYSLSFILLNGVLLSGSGNNRTFSMPAANAVVSAGFVLTVKGPYITDTEPEGFEEGEADQTFTDFGNGYFVSFSHGADAAAFFDGAEKTEGTKSGRMDFNLGSDAAARFGRTNYPDIDLRAITYLTHFSFQARASVAGLYTIIFRNGDSFLDHPADFNIQTPETWELIEIPLDSICGEDDRDAVYYIAFQVDSGRGFANKTIEGSLWIDNIKFIRK